MFSFVIDLLVGVVFLLNIIVLIGVPGDVPQAGCEDHEQFFKLWGAPGFRRGARELGEVRAKWSRAKHIRKHIESYNNN